MITAIEIENFQSHEHTKVEPAPDGHLTVIIGPSDSGKTAVFRALRWVAYNVPQGTDFIRAGASRAKVTVILSDGRRIVRERTRGGGVNRYIIFEDGKEDQIFEGIGASVPLEVQDALGIRQVAIGDLELNLNLAEQLDGPFLGKSVPATGKAKILGKLAGTEEVDYASKMLGTDLYRRRQDEKRLTGEVRQVEEQLKAYDYLEDLDRRIDQAAALLAAMKDARERRERLEQLGGRLINTKRDLRIAETVIDRLGLVLLAARPAINAAEQALDRHGRLVGLGEKSAENKRWLDAVNATLDKTKGTQLAAAMLEGAVADANRFSRLRVLDVNLARTQSDINTAVRVLKRVAPITKADALLATAQERIQRLEALRLLASQHGRVVPGMAKAGEILGQCARILTAGPRLEAIENLITRRAGLATKRGTLDDALRAVSGAKAQVVRAAKEVEGTQAAYEALMEEAGTCPLCGAKVKQMRLKEVV